MEYDEIFSNEPPMPRRKATASAAAKGEKQPKHKYVRKTPPAAPGGDTAVITPEEKLRAKHPSVGLEYIQALAALLALLAEPQRNKPADFIIQERIV